MGVRRVPGGGGIVSSQIQKMSIISRRDLTVGRPARLLGRPAHLLPQLSAE